MNAGAPFDLVATAGAADSTFAGIVRLVRQAQEAKAPSARLADRAAFLFTPLAIGLAGTAWALTGDPVRGLAVMVVATPCPLILGVPVAVVSGLSRCAGRGVLVKGGGALEALARVRTLFLDKTGTLTAGRARVAAIQTAPGATGDEILRLAASLDQTSQHTIAQAVVAAARARALALALPTEVDEEPGAGVTGTVEGRRVSVGSHAYVAARAAPADWGERFLRRMGTRVLPAPSWRRTARCSGPFSSPTRSGRTHPGRYGCYARPESSASSCSRVTAATSPRRSGRRSAWTRCVRNKGRRTS